VSDKRDNVEAARRKRRVLVLASLPFVLVALGFVVHVVNLYLVTNSALTSYHAGQYTESEEQSSKLVEPNIVERYLPYFNRGDAKAADQEYTAAIDDFEIALDLAPASRQCAVAVNLAHTWELLADSYVAAGFNDGAVQLYQAAEDVIASVDGECEPPDPASDALDGVESDVAEKKSAADRAARFEELLERGGSGSDDLLDDLGSKQRESDEEKANGDARNRSETGSGDGYVDKPW
jgi:tetratricopeptide (TPR) repeat protein